MTLHLICLGWVRRGRSGSRERGFVRGLPSVEGMRRR